MSNESFTTSEGLKELLARASSSRRCLTLKTRIAGGKPTWEASLAARNPKGFGGLDEAVDSLLDESDPLAAPTSIYDANTIGELLVKVEKLTSATFTFQADYRKSGGNVFKAEILEGFQVIARKGGNDAEAVLGEVLGKAGLL
jgi:hypothetical protein